MAEATNYQCPNCQGRLFYDGEIGKLKCEFCESTFTPQEVEDLYAQRQAKADAKAAGDRMQANAQAEQSALQERSAQAMQAAYDQAIAAGLQVERAARDVQVPERWIVCVLAMDGICRGGDGERAVGDGD